MLAFTLVFTLALVIVGPFEAVIVVFETILVPVPLPVGVASGSYTATSIVPSANPEALMVDV